MPITSPLASAGDRDPRKRARPIPRPVRDAITLMVFNVDDPDCAPLNFIEAAKLADIVNLMRRYLDRADVRALLRSERRAFRDAICAGNEGALQRIRNTSPNGMAVIASVRALEGLEAAEAAARPLGDQTPGITIRIIQAASALPVITTKRRERLNTSLRANSKNRSFCREWLQRR